MKISIITPSFNQGRFIERTIQSVLGQTISDLEYFVMDGGSNDETLTILKKYSHQLSYVSEEDHGQAHAVNKGLKKASGDIIGWLNSDDIYYPDTLKKVRDYFERYPMVDVMYGNAYHIDENEIILECYPTDPWDVKAFKKKCFISQPTVFWRRSLLTQFGFLDETLHYCMDYEYWLRLALGGARFDYLPQFLAGSRLYPQTKTGRFPVAAMQEALSMLKQRIHYVPINWVVNYSVLFIKQNSLFYFPDVRFFVCLIKTVISEAFKWNGSLRGLQACFSFPFIMLKIFKQKRYQRRL